MQFVQRHWPSILLGVLTLVGYWDLKTDLMELRLAGTSVRGSALVTTPAASPPQDVPLLEAYPSQPPGLTSPEVPSVWECEGQITRQALGERVRSFGPDVFRCHQEVGEDARGTLFLALLVNDEARVREIYYSGMLATHGPLTSCITRSAREWTIVEPIGGDCAIATLPFSLGTTVLATD